MDLGADGAQALIDHVSEYGTDGDGGAAQDDAVGDALAVILDQI